MPFEGKAPRVLSYLDQFLLDVHTYLCMQVGLLGKFFFPRRICSSTSFWRS